MPASLAACRFTSRYTEKPESGRDACRHSKTNYCCGRGGLVFFLNTSAWSLAKGHAKLTECPSLPGIRNCSATVSKAVLGSREPMGSATALGSALQVGPTCFKVNAQAIQVGMTNGVLLFENSNFKDSIQVFLFYSMLYHRDRL